MIRKILLLSILMFLSNCKKELKQPISQEVKKVATKKNEKAVPSKVKVIKKPKMEKKWNVLKSLCAKAKKGLLYRDKPRGKVLGKLDYARRVDIVERTSDKMTIEDEGKEISGEWVGILIEENNKQFVAYVFDGFLENCVNVNLSEMEKVTPPYFKQEIKKVLLLPKKFTTYNENFKPKGELSIEKIREAKQLQITKLRHSKNKNDDYCEHSNFIKIKYQGKEYIIFGENVLHITSKSELKYQGEKIEIIQAKNYTQEASDEDGATYCPDFNYVLLKKDHYSLIYNNSKNPEDKRKFMVLDDNNGVGETIENYYIRNGRIRAKVKQGFQEGTGSYNISFYFHKKWKYSITNIERNYNNYQE